MRLECSPHATFEPGIARPSPRPEPHQDPRAAARATSPWIRWSAAVLVILGDGGHRPRLRSIRLPLLLPPSWG